MLSEVLYNPEFIKKLLPDEIIEIYQKTGAFLKTDSAFIKLHASQGYVIFAGDTHGDFSTTTYIVKRFIENPDKYYIVFLGDYIDREPEPEGSLWNLTYLCILKINFPERVFLLKGNHEAHYAFYCHPYEFDQELIDIFGSYGVSIHSEAVRLFKEMPLMLQTSNGIVASHGGFPLRGQKVNDKSKEDLIVDILWADAEISPMFRGYGIPNFNEKELTDFLNSINASCLVRGHDYHIAGKVIYSNRCLTIFTCRRYATHAGILLAKSDLSKKIKDARDLEIEDITAYLDTY